MTNETKNKPPIPRKRAFENNRNERTWYYEIELHGTAFISRLC